MKRNDFAALLRPRIGVMAAAGAGAGWLMATSGTGPGLLPALAAGFLLSCGASALNQAQEAAQDARMERTRNRPVASGRLGAPTAALLGLCCAGLAAALLFTSPGGLAAALLVPLTLLVYNGLYTPLKKRTSLAMLVGGLAGALPPVLGFAASGANPLDARALLLAGVFYAWQVPHFWLFARIHRTDYEAAGFRVPHNGVAEGRAAGTLGIWLVSYGASMLLLPAFGLVDAPVIKWLMAALALGLVACPKFIHARERLGLVLVNASLALFLAFLAVDALRLTA
jgi:Polyprenyltransferase (cytochrome oxidase assembly factor)